MPSFENIQTEIAAMLSIPDEELTDEQRKAMDQYLDELAQAESDKIDGFCAFLREETARVKFYREESARLSCKARAAEGRISFLKHKYLSILQEHGIEKVKGNAYSLSIKHTPSVVIEDETDLDDIYCRVIPEKREPDKRTILEALKGGVEIPGCRLVQSDSLQIR